MSTLELVLDFKIRAISIQDMSPTDDSPTFIRYRLSRVCDSRSTNWPVVGGDPRNMKSFRLLLTAILFVTQFYRAEEAR